MRLTGNVYIYTPRVEGGRNAGKPMAYYLLPSHMTQIVLKEGADMLGIEDPIDHYILTEGSSFIKI